MYQQRARDGPRNRSRTNDEHPLPALQAAFAFHRLVHCRHHETSAHTPDLPDRSKDGSPFGYLGRLAAGIVSIFPWKGTRSTYYHEPITYTLPLYKLASIKPWKKRTAQSCEYVLHPAEHMVKRDQRIRVNGSHMLGRTFWMMRPWGIWPTTRLRSCQLECYDTPAH